MVGQDLPIERGIPVLDRSDWVGDARAGQRVLARRGMDRQRQRKPEDAPWRWRRVPSSIATRRRLGPTCSRRASTTIGLRPDGRRARRTGASSVRPRGSSARGHDASPTGVIPEDLLRCAATRASKKLLRGALRRGRRVQREGGQKAREKFEKDLEKKAKKKKKDDKDEGGRRTTTKEDEPRVPFEYTPPRGRRRRSSSLPWQLRAGELNALVSINGAAEYLHWLDAIGDEEFEWNLRVDLNARQRHLDDVEDKIGEARAARPDSSRSITLHPGDDAAAQPAGGALSEAGAKIAFVPQLGLGRADTRPGSSASARSFAAGLDRQAALRR